MPVTSSAVGTRVRGDPIAITDRLCLAYAAAIGDTSRAVFDDLVSGFQAPPQMCVALEWPVVSDARLAEALGATRDEAIRAVHAVQDSTFHRPVRPGDRLVTEGCVRGIDMTRAGARTAMKLETRTVGGELVASSWSFTIYRGVTLAGAPRRHESPPEWPEVGSLVDLDPVTIPIRREMPHVYTECARIWNPIHTERRVAKATGLPDRILHGTATWALVGREIIGQVAAGLPSRLRRLSGRFTGILVPGTMIGVFLRHGSTADGATIVRYEVRTGGHVRTVVEGAAIVEK